MLNVGDIAPDFTLPAADGQNVTLTDLLKQSPVLVYFYPADFTPVCTKQACMLRDTFKPLRDRGVRIIGISAQKPQTHERFKDKYNVPFQLLSDPGRTVARAYQATAAFGLLPRRITYLIDQDQRIADAAQASFSLDAHRQLIERVIEQYQ